MTFAGYLLLIFRTSFIKLCGVLQEINSTPRPEIRCVWKWVYRGATPVTIINGDTDQLNPVQRVTSHGIQIALHISTIRTIEIRRLPM